jgi:Cu-processing system permease protein
MRWRALVSLTLREMFHEKIFLSVIFLVGGVFALSEVLGALSFSEQQKIMADFGFLAIEFAAVLVSALYGSFAFSREMERQTALLILARPISRQEFISAKFAGILVFNFLLVAISSAILFLLLKAWSFDNGLLNMFWIGSSIFLKSALLLALALALSIRVRSSLTLLFTVAVYLLGHWMNDLLFFTQKFGDPFLLGLLKALNLLCPQFYRMNWKSYYFLEKGPESLEVAWMFMHSLGWILILMFVTRLVLRRKDIV